ARSIRHSKGVRRLSPKLKRLLPLRHADNALYICFGKPVGKGFDGFNCAWCCRYWEDFAPNAREETIWNIGRDWEHHRNTNLVFFELEQRNQNPPFFALIKFDINDLRQIRANSRY